MTAAAEVIARAFKPGWRMPQEIGERAAAALRDAGLQVVPREPTLAMGLAGFDHRGYEPDVIYRAMLKAAEKQP